MRRIEIRDKILSFFAAIILAPFIFFLEFIKRKKKKVSFSKTKKILVVEFWKIGDLVMVTAPIKALKKKYPHAQITLAASPISLELLKDNPYIDRIIPYEAPWVEHKFNFLKYNYRQTLNFIRKLRSERYDIALDYRGDFRDNIILYLSGARERIGYGFTGGAFLLTQTIPLDPKSVHQIDQSLNLNKYLKVDFTDIKPQLYTTEKERKNAKKLLACSEIEDANFVVGIHPGASWEGRLWEVNKFAEVIKYLIHNKKKVILIGGEREKYIIDAIIDETKLAIPAFYPSLRGLIALFQCLDLIICMDSGPMHIASAVDAPLIALFGPQKAEWFGPYGNRHLIIQADNVPCRPCQQKRCLVHPSCMERISVSMVINAVKKMLKEYRDIDF